jgi:NAD(P)-dependent dehydrogenase (short-subunit alcohol dehydrogenase family)
METPMTEMWTPQQRAQRIASNPLKRIGQPEEVAAVILGLATTMTSSTARSFRSTAAACCKKPEAVGGSDE